MAQFYSSSVSDGAVLLVRIGAGKGLRPSQSAVDVHVNSHVLPWRGGVLTRKGALRRRPGRKTYYELSQLPPRLPPNGGVYTPAERKRVIQSYLRKRSARLEHGVTAFVYKSRVRFARSRMRDKGRFVGLNTKNSNV